MPTQGISVPSKACPKTQGGNDCWIIEFIGGARPARNSPTQRRHNLKTQLLPAKTQLPRKTQMQMKARLSANTRLPAKTQLEDATIASEDETRRRNCLRGRNWKIQIPTKTQVEDTLIASKNVVEFPVTCEHKCQRIPRRQGRRKSKTLWPAKSQQGRDSNIQLRRRRQRGRRS